MAQDPQGDVARAMAAFGAEPIAYRNFSSISPASVDPTTGPPDSFPLLAAALPELQSPPPPVRAASEPGQQHVAPPPTLAPDRREAASPAVGAEAPSAGLKAPHLPTVVVPRQSLPATGSLSQRPGSAPPLRAQATYRPRQPASVSPLGNTPAAMTPLKAVFRSLQGANAPPETPVETETVLQHMFSLL